MIARTYNLMYKNSHGYPVYIHVREFQSGRTWMGGYEISKNHLTKEELDLIARELHHMMDLSDTPVEVVP